MLFIEQRILSYIICIFLEILYYFQKLTEVVNYLYNYLQLAISYSIDKLFVAVLAQAHTAKYIFIHRIIKWLCKEIRFPKIG